MRLVPARLLLAAVAALVLIGAVVLAVLVSSDRATPDEPLRRRPPPPAASAPLPAELTGEPTRGASVFASTGCGNCHTLASAGSTGTIGPVLDGRTPDYPRFFEQVSAGGGGMPPYAGTLSAQQIDDVVAYVIASIESGRP